MRHEFEASRRVPAAGCRLTLKRAGWPGFLRRNLGLGCIDLGEDGLTALVRESLWEGECVRVALEEAGGGTCRAEARVVSVRPSRSRQGRFVAQLEFVELSGAARFFLRRRVDTGAVPSARTVSSLQPSG